MLAVIDKHVYNQGVKSLTVIVATSNIDIVVYLLQFAFTDHFL